MYLYLLDDGVIRPDLLRCDTFGAPAVVGPIHQPSDPSTSSIGKPLRLLVFIQSSQV